MNDLYINFSYTLEPWLVLGLKVLAVYFLYKIARNLRSILKEICHIGNTKMGKPLVLKKRVK